MNTKFVEEILQKKETKRLLLNIFKTEYSNLETDEMMLKFK